MDMIAPVRTDAPRDPRRDGFFPAGITAPTAASASPSRCSICKLREADLPCDLLRPGPGQREALPSTHWRVRQGEALFRCGDAFSCLYTVRSGFFKTVMPVASGRELVTGFHMAGDLLGADALVPQSHVCDAIALEESQVCASFISGVDGPDHAPPLPYRQLFKAMSAQISRQQGLMLVLGMLRAEERVAAFLLGLSQRLGARGYSPTHLKLRMTRREIGCHLGLELETVSRMISKFREAGIVETGYRRIQILDLDGLRRFIGPTMA